MAPQYNWSRAYFIKQPNGKFACQFCSREYIENVSKWKNHLKNQCQKMNEGIRKKIRSKSDDEGSPVTKKLNSNLVAIDTRCYLSSSPSEKSTSLSNVSSRIEKFFDQQPDENEKANLDILLTRAMVTGNIPANFLDNPFWKELFRKLRPAYNLPSRFQFSTTLLNMEYQRVEKMVEKAVNSADFLALSSDGWTDVSSHRLINVVVHTPKPFLFSTIDATLEEHTGFYICDVLSDQIEKLGPRKVVAVMTDNASNMKLAWRLLEQKFPWIIFDGCKAHSVDLAAKDFCNEPSVKEFVHNCNKIAKFFRKRIPSQLLAENQLKTVGSRFLLQLPTPTRWYSTWSLISNVVKYEAALKKTIWDEKLETENGCSEIRDLLCKAEHFWSTLKLIEQVLYPLAAVIKCIEGDVVDARAAYKKIDSAFDQSIKNIKNFGNKEFCGRFTEIMNERKKFCENKIVYLMDLLEPTDRGTSLDSEQMDVLLNILSEKILKNPIFAGKEEQVIAEIGRYKARTGEFAKEKRPIIWSSLESGTLDAESFWNAYYSSSNLCTIFNELKSIPITSAVTERNWSIRSAIHTKVRNRLLVATASSLTYIKHNLLLEYSEFFKQNESNLEETELESDGSAVDVESIEIDLSNDGEIIFSD